MKQGRPQDTPPAPPPFDTDTRYMLDDPTCGQVGFLAEHIYNGGVWVRFQGYTTDNGQRTPIDNYGLVSESRDLRPIPSTVIGSWSSHGLRPCQGRYFVRRWYNQAERHEWIHFVGLAIGMT
eukprot:TRINITY_DN68098_c9_g13_i1.p2 TRINITY_DN68098_c9_g13~~TRINITY_DN68098_c9_g13_i1.p2  ORF type:complete len:122 (-),score=8.82 TRINITY_DN68098_c9_g13_i1:295-660(-)